MIGIPCENELKSGKEYKWKIKILKSKYYYINVGITTTDFDFNKDNRYKYGWYLYCENSTFYSWSPQNYSGKKTKLKKPKNEIIISMNIQKRILKFKVDNEEEEDFYTDIPIDKPIIPIVTLQNKDDSVEIISN